MSGLGESKEIVRKWNRELIGQKFYKICQDNKSKQRTIEFKWNSFVQSQKPMIFNPIDGASPEEMKPVPVGAFQRAAQMKNMTGDELTTQEIPISNLRPHPCRKNIN